MISANLASIATRERELRVTVSSLYRYVDRINVGLNLYESIPKFLRKKKINAWLCDNSKGDAEKFRSEDKGYYLTCDDDLIYPPDYVKTLLEAIDKYKSIVTCHGRSFNGPLVSYYRSATERYHCLHDVSDDVKVHVGGTGVMGFHTDHFEISIDEFEHRNMADVFVGKKAAENQVAIMCLQHRKGWIQYQKTMRNKVTIFDQASRNDVIQTELLASFIQQILHKGGP